MWRNMNPPRTLLVALQNFGAVALENSLVAPAQKVKHGVIIRLSTSIPMYIPKRNEKKFTQKTTNFHRAH